MVEAALICMALNVYYESKHEPIDGLMGVAQVVINRANGDASRYCNVVFEPKQFSWANRLTMVPEKKRAKRAASYIPPNDKHWKASIEVAKLALSGKMRNPVGNAKYFHSTSIEPNSFFKTRKFLKQIGNHKFYL